MIVDGGGEMGVGSWGLGMFNPNPQTPTPNP